MTEVHLTWLLLYVALELCGVAAFLLWRRVRIARLVGSAAHATRASRRLRRASVAAVWCVTLALWFFVASPDDRAGAAFGASLGLLAVASAVWLASPMDGDRDLGARGVRSGWDAFGFEQFSEWRLSGEHLRFRLDGRLWDAAAIRPEAAPDLRERLQSLAADRESRYAE